MKKKLLTALLVGAMALNITACGGSSDAAAPADNDQQTTTTDTAADDAADTEEDAVDVEDAAEAADTTEAVSYTHLSCRDNPSQLHLIHPMRECQHGAYIHPVSHYRENKHI